MKQTVKLLNAYHVADLFGDLLRKKLPTTSVESLCCKLCMGLPSGRRITLINTVMKWKQIDAWSVVRTERYNNTKIWRENRPILDEENVTHAFNIVWEKEKNRYGTLLQEKRKRKVDFLRQTFGKREEQVVTKIAGITVTDQVIPQNFSSSPRCYGNIETTKNEEEILSLPSKFAVFDRVDLGKCEAQVEKGFAKLR